MDKKDRGFVEQRRVFIRTWPVLGGGLLVILLAIYAWLSVTQPALTNPVYTVNALSRGTLSPDMLKMLAVAAPICFVLIFAVIGIFLIIGFGLLKKEKHLIDIIDKLNS